MTLQTVFRAAAHKPGSSLPPNLPTALWPMPGPRSLWLAQTWGCPAHLGLSLFQLRYVKEGKKSL